MKIIILDKKKKKKKLIARALMRLVIILYIRKVGLNLSTFIFDNDKRLEV